MRLNPALEAPLSDVYPEAETHRLRCGRVVPRVSVDPNCGIRVEFNFKLKALAPMARDGAR
jgi:hypothetical protein